MAELGRLMISRTYARAAKRFVSFGEMNCFVCAVFALPPQRGLRSEREVAGDRDLLIAPQGIEIAQNGLANGGAVSGSWERAGGGPHPRLRRNLKHLRSFAKLREHRGIGAGEEHLAAEARERVE